MRSKGFAIWLCRGLGRLRSAQDNIYHLSSWGPERIPRSTLSHCVSPSMPSSALCMSASIFQARIIGYLPLGRGPCTQKALFALTASIGRVGCDREWNLAQLAVNSSAALSAHTNCHSSNCLCTYFPSETICPDLFLKPEGTSLYDPKLLNRVMVVTPTGLFPAFLLCSASPVSSPLPLLRRDRVRDLTQTLRKESKTVSGLEAIYK